MLSVREHFVRQIGHVFVGEACERVPCCVVRYPASLCECDQEQQTRWFVSTKISVTRAALIRLAIRNVQLEGIQYLRGVSFANRSMLLGCDGQRPSKKKDRPRASATHLALRETGDLSQPDVRITS